MNPLAIMSVSLILYGQSITISHGGSVPSDQGTPEYSTGSVRIDPLFSAAEPSRMAGARVTFEPGAQYGLPLPPTGADADCHRRDGLGRQ